MLGRLTILLTTLLGLVSVTHADQLTVGKPFPIVPLPLCSDPPELTTIEEFRGHKLMLHLFASW